jgi:fatty-acyl-CoA synthase
MVIKPDYKNGVPMVTWKMFEEDYFDQHLVHEVIEKWAKVKPNSLAMIAVNSEQKFTWKEFDDIATAIAYKFIQMGIKKGDFIGTSLPFFPEHIFIEYACFKIGAVVVPLDLRLKPTEVMKCLSMVKARVFFHLGETDVADFKKMAEIIRDNVDFIDYYIQFSKPDTLMETRGNYHVLSAWEFAKSAQEIANDIKNGKSQDIAKKYKEMHDSIQEKEGCMVIYTTGSTGYPKPALLSHVGITAQNLCLGWGFKMTTDTETMLVNLPPSHVGGQSEQLMAGLFFGGKVAVLDIFKPDLSLEAIQKYKITLLGQIPALFNLEWRLPNYNTYDLSSLKFALYGGQAVSRQFLEKLSMMAPRFGSGLGLTELSGMCTYTPIDGSIDDIIDGIGYAMPITPISIRKPMKEDGSAGDECKPGEIGEICFSGPQVFLGYVNDAENTKKTISKDCWCYTGDVGSYDNKGLHLSGRSKLMIKPKGYNVYPVEVENFIYDNFKDRVENVGVIGAKHEVFGEGIIAFVEKKKGKTLTAAELDKACNEGLTVYKRPSHIVILEYTQMPLNRVEKVDYQSLKNMAEVEIKKLREAGGWDRK